MVGRIESTKVINNALQRRNPGLGKWKRELRFIDLTVLYVSLKQASYKLRTPKAISRRGKHHWLWVATIEVIGFKIALV